MSGFTRHSTGSAGLDEVLGGGLIAGRSYLADTIVFLRHVELRGELQKAIGVLKKRTGNCERTLRQFEVTSSGIRVGEPLS
jgi:circadian clock protein KaiC